MRATLIRALESPRLALLACILLFLFAAALVLKSGNQVHWPDESIYVGIAKGLAQGHGFLNDKGEVSAFRPPGYPYVISLVFRLSESVLLAKLLSVFALTAAAWLLAQLVRTLMPQTYALAPILVLAYPVLAYTTTMLTPQNLGDLFFVAGLLLLFRHPTSLLAAAASGVLFGVLILFIPSFALVLACLGLVLAAGRFWIRTYSPRYLAILFVAMTAVVTPWVVRSSLLFHDFVFVSTNSGSNLLFGNSPNAKYNTGVVDISAFKPAAPLGEVELDRHYKQAATRWIREHPFQAAQLYLGKVANYFNYRNEISTTSMTSRAANVVMFLTYYPLLLIALVRCTQWRHHRFSYPELLLYLIYFGNAFLAAIVYTRIRYRLPFDFLLIAMVSVYVGQILQSRKLIFAK